MTNKNENETNSINDLHGQNSFPHNFKIVKLCDFPCNNKEEFLKEDKRLCEIRKLQSNITYELNQNVK